jgi:hypothetical protein
LPAFALGAREGQNIGVLTDRLFDGGHFAYMIFVYIGFLISAFLPVSPGEAVF